MLRRVWMMAARNAASNAPVADPGRAPGLPAVEVRTLALILASYAAWLAITFAYRSWPLWIVAPVGAVVLTLHSSLQHEILHGHPTRWRALNSLLGIVPLSLWLPYRRYRDLHLTHHVNDRLTDPHDDPETNYWDPDDWARLGPLGRGLVRIQLTLVGRILIGPFWRIPRFLYRELRSVIRDERRARQILAGAPPLVRASPAVGQVRLRHAHLGLRAGVRGPRQRDPGDPLVRRASRASRR